MFQVGDRVVFTRTLNKKVVIHATVISIDVISAPDYPTYVVQSDEGRCSAAFESELADVMIPITLTCTLESLKSLDGGRAAECGCGERVSTFGALAEHLELPIARVRQYWWGRDHDRCSN